MNRLRNRFDATRFIFTFALLVWPASLAETIHNGNTDLFAPRHFCTRAIGIASVRKVRFIQ